MIVEIKTGQMVGKKGVKSWQYWITYSRRQHHNGSRYARLLGGETMPPPFTGSSTGRTPRSGRGG